MNNSFVIYELDGSVGEGGKDEAADILIQVSEFEERICSAFIRLK